MRVVNQTYFLKKGADSQRERIHVNGSTYTFNFGATATAAIGALGSHVATGGQVVGNEVVLIIETVAGRGGLPVKVMAPLAVARAVVSSRSLTSHGGVTFD